MAVKTYEPEQSPFKILYVDVTHRCQMNCANCYIPNRNVPDMDFELFSQCLKRLPRKTDIRIIGGEPTLRKDLPEIITEIRKLGHRPVLITNGLKLASPEYTKSLKQAGLKYLQLSFNGGRHDNIYRITDEMDCATQKLQALKNCVDTGLSVSLSCILIDGVNTHLVPELIELVTSLPKPARINFRNVGAVGRHTASRFKVLSLSEIASLIAETLKIEATELLKSKVASNQIRFPYPASERYSNQIVIKCTDWSIFQKEVFSDPKATVRGRMTPDFKVAPHFEHVKENEYGY